MQRRAFSVAIFARHTSTHGVRRVLLVHHKRLGTWLPVGGEVEEGETFLEAARRELREETGLEGRFPTTSEVVGVPPGFLAYEEHEAGSKGLHMNACFVADIDTDVIPPHAEFTEHRFVDDASDLPCPPNVRQLVRQALHHDEPALIGVARRWLDRFNARDLEGLLALYADDAVHTSPKLRDRQPETKGQVRGKDALRAWWSDAMQRLPQLRYDELHLTAQGNRVFMEYLRVCPPEPDLVVAEVLVVENARITQSHVFHG
jgi:ADP-ribose pyrophosphatase YjhB (NUDIX family)